MADLATDFNATLAIINPSPLTKEIINNLPDNYDKTYSSGQFPLLYGTGYEFENLSRTLKQAEANNYLYSPDTQIGSFSIQGIGIYLIEFEIPFVVPPLNVSVSGSDYTDVIIEYTSTFYMVVNVLNTYGQDTLQYNASGFVGAASDEYLGDALYNNFGSLYNFPRAGDSVINDTYVSFYEKINTFINVDAIIAVQNIVGEVQFDSDGNPIFNQNIVLAPVAPPAGRSYLKGLINPTSVITNPQSTHELVDLSGNLLALLDASTISSSVSSFYPNSNQNFYKKDAQVYITGTFSTFEFDRWNQPSYQQEVFRADNKYRRILSGINKSLYLGPTVNGVSNLIEALIAQPFIPSNIWNQSDFRIFKNSIGLAYPKYNYGNPASQYDGYPLVKPTVVEIERILQPWTPDNITFNTRPLTTPIENPVTQTVTALNNATRFDITNELTRQLRLAINIPNGGIVNWNYQNLNTIASSGNSIYENFNYFFLNNPGDSINNLNLIWYAQQNNTNGPTGYKTFGPLQNNRDYFIALTQNFLLIDAYSLPSELLYGYNANSNIPYVSGQPDIYGNLMWLGAELVNAGTLPNSTPSLPQFMIQLDLSILSIYNNNNISTKMPTNPYDFILYSYAQINIYPATVTGNFSDISAINSNKQITTYYDADLPNSFQPINTPFITTGNSLSQTSFAQTSFAKLVSSTNYEYIVTMIGGQVTFNKTIYVDNIKSQSAVAGASTLSAPGILVLQAFKISDDLNNSNPIGQVGQNQFTLNGIVDRIISSTTGKGYFQFDFGKYVLLDLNGNPIAIFDDSSPIRFETLIGQNITVTGVVFYTLWDTRIPVTDYITGSPIFQVTSNFNTTVTPLTPNILPNYINNNYLVKINGLPIGNQQTVTASWSFNILPANLNSDISSSSIPFSDTYTTTNGVSSFQFGIMSYFTGLALNQSGNDPDEATYVQNYTSPSLNGFFLNYNDYINAIGSKISSYGDSNTLNTLTNPIYGTNSYNSPQLNTVLNFFSPKYGFISFSILPDMEFVNANNGIPVNIERPNNNGLALQIQGDSYAGLVFYGNNQDKIVDKPTRLVVNFTYATTQQQNRKKIIEIEDGGYANWVDASNPNTVQDNSTFYIVGNQFKYPHDSYDQSINQYGVNSVPTSPPPNDQYYNRFPTNGNSPIFFTDPSQNVLSNLPDNTSQAGPPMRYRRVQPDVNPTNNQNITAPQIVSGYSNNSPEKISYIQFNLSDFPIDTVVNNAYLEIYFCSGFTIKQFKDVDFELNNNKAWEKSRLSGNGKTYVQTLTDPISGTYTLRKPEGNVHWRKNFFEISIPYAFSSEPNDTEYGIRNLFNSTTYNTLPQTTNPQPNLEYLGFLNIDEINTTNLTGSNFIEITVGLANIILSTSSIIYEINGILSFTTDTNGNTVLLNQFDSTNQTIYTLNGETVLGNIIDQNNVLPNMKILIYPYGFSPPTYSPSNSSFIYGYVKSLLPSTYIGFTSTDISIYQNALNYVQPLYSNYIVRALEADTYFSYLNFGKDTTIANTTSDITN